MVFEKIVKKMADCTKEDIKNGRCKCEREAYIEQTNFRPEEKIRVICKKRLEK